MQRNIALLLTAQFVTAFADNAVLFGAIALARTTMETGEWYIPMLQAAFLLAFVLLAPWIGAWADSRPKHQVLVMANFVKAAGALLVILHFDALLALFVIGAGAALYGPAKYGIAPELADEDKVVELNGWLEGSTIVAIILGMWVGATVADRDIAWNFYMVVACYLLSAAVAAFMSSAVPKLAKMKWHIGHFIYLNRKMLSERRARYALLGDVLFWSSVAVLRPMVVLWAPVVLSIAVNDTASIAELILASAVGIVVGSLVASKLIPLEQLARTRYAALLMGVAILFVSLATNEMMARVALFLVGIAGGIFVVPINAAIQEIGQKSVGAGGAVSVQLFLHNVGMLLLTLIYTLVADHVPASYSIMTLGILVLLATAAVSRNLRNNEDTS